MSKTFRRAAMSTICMLIVAVMSLTGATYAWFTVGTQATVENFNIDVEAAAGNLVIAMKGDQNTLTWGTSIRPFGTAENPTVAGKMTPVSANAAAAAAPVFFGAALDTNTVDFKTISAISTPSVTEGENTKINYLTFDFYVSNATGANQMDITLADIAGFTGASAQALRVAIVQYDTFATNANPTTTNDMDAIATIARTNIFEPNATSHTDSGKADYKYVKGINSTKYTVADEDAKYETYPIVAATVSDADDANNSRVDGVALSTTAQTTFNDTTTVIASFGAHTAGKITVYIWLEGQDHDCLNDVAATQMVLPIKLQAAFVTPGQGN